MVKASEFKPEGPSLDPLVEQGGRHIFSVLPSELLRRLVCVYARHAPTFVRTLNIPHPSVVKKSRPHSRRYGNTKTQPRGGKKKEKKLGSAVIWLLAFLGGEQPKFLMDGTGTRTLSNLIMLCTMRMMITQRSELYNSTFYRGVVEIL